MTKPDEMATKFDPQTVEAGMYQHWLDEDVFKPSGNPAAKPYSIVLPPPNVTGKLHLGHAWDTTLQDMLIRQKRMEGYDTLWIPGMDHAGIATQAKVEAMLHEQGISRYDLGRTDFIKQVWAWKDKFAQTIHEQWAKLGLSLDYQRETFTLDDQVSAAVRKVFVTLYNQGLIYRAKYIINWDPQAQTALSDIEVVHQDDQGAFYHVKYPFTDGTTFNGKPYIEIATTRPETMFGDTAVAVNPSDSRYQELVGKEVMVPLVNRKIPIIADHYVDPEFGTGMVKITPAHDPNDFKVGKRHQLAEINTMNPDATLNEAAGKYEGMERFAARKAIVADLQAAHVLLSVDPLVHSVGHSERTGVQVEARLSTQWFVKMKPLAEAALANQKTDDAVNFVPERFENVFNQWMENVHDWVISRQLWWGHRIPAWYHKKTHEIYVGEQAPDDPENWEQDPDVLDTWFSSALWPFTTLGWPDTSSDFERYFPTETMVTGYDIVFFWVSRMIFQSLHFTGKRPFKNVLLHGLIRDEQGRKMSKSLGNGIDPMDVIEKYGADALRWSLSTGTTPGQDERFSYDKMDASWKFVNKIWNASRYVIMNLGDLQQPQLPAASDWNLADRWILARLNRVIGLVRTNYDKFNFGEANRALYDFIWNDFCDWYIEMSKETLTGDDEQAKQNTRNLLAYILDQTLRLLHPVMPFVTEKIWLSMPHTGRSLVVAAYPDQQQRFVNQTAEDDMEHLIEVIKAIRNIRAEANAPLKRPVDILIKTDNAKLREVLQTNREYLDRFGHPQKLVIADQVTVPDLAMTAVVTDAEISIPLAELVDLKEEATRMQKEVAEFTAEVQRSKRKLDNQHFVENAPADLVAEERQKQTINQNKLVAAEQRLAKIKAAIAN
ncbi:Valyl-tRNA synthetase [Fructilactobacillus florum 8D]|uniref:Valine--tRNA ligase n=1 Tax=Fructilactobacillus florum 8D TaxID=1221538 RepID=W9ECT8_9LACO|nr:valine--tRNA ligase [Fructilactobacillus florum]ETO39877.1 Valyl-tRNA synthetase [Fructilactobacillus florum 8D]